MSTLSREVQPKKAWEILVTEFGISTLPKDVQPLNAPEISVTELGMSTLSKDVQPLNTSVISVTELGKSTFLREEQPLNASLPIDVTERGISIQSKEVQFSKAPLQILIVPSLTIKEF